jgi:hypothetical protein
MAHAIMTSGGGKVPQAEAHAPLDLSDALRATLQHAATVLPQMPSRVAWNRVPLRSLLSVFEFLSPTDLSKVQQAANLPSSQIRLPEVRLSESECKTATSSMLKSMQLWGRHTRTLHLANDMQFAWLYTEDEGMLTPIFPALETLIVDVVFQLEPESWQALLEWCPRLTSFTCRRLEVHDSFTEADWKEEKQRPWRRFDVTFEQGSRGDQLSISTLLDVFANPNLVDWRVDHAEIQFEDWEGETWTLEHTGTLRKRVAGEDNQTVLDKLQLPFICDRKDSDAIVLSLLHDYPGTHGTQLFLNRAWVSSEALRTIYETVREETELPSSHFRVSALPPGFSFPKRAWPLNVHIDWRWGHGGEFAEWKAADVAQLLVSFTHWNNITVLADAEDSDTMDSKTIQTVLSRNKASIDGLKLAMRCEVDDAVLVAATQGFRAGVLHDLWLGHSTVHTPKRSTVRPEVFAELVDAAASQSNATLVLLFGVLSQLTFDDINVLVARLQRLHRCEFLVNKNVGDKILQHKIGRLRVGRYEGEDFVKLFV